MRFQMIVNGVPWAGGGGEGLPLTHFVSNLNTLLVAFCLAHPQAGDVRTVELVAVPETTEDESYLCSDDTLDLLRAMKEYGGSFASSLAEAWLYADLGNRKQLERVFRPLLERYRKFLSSPR